MKIKPSIALVTGASSGIGEATAERLAKAGYKVYGTSRRGGRRRGSSAIAAQICPGRPDRRGHSQRSESRRFSRLMPRAVTKRSARENI